MTPPSYKTIFVHKRGSSAVVSLNRPDVRNALEPAMISELRAAFEGDLNVDPAIVSVELRGAGRSFCAGADLAWMKSMASFSFEENRRDADELYAMLLALRACPVPLIGRAHGHVYGGALGLLAACDVAFAEAKTQFCFSEVKIGLAPAVISPFVLEKMRFGAAASFMLSGLAFGADEARDAGLLAAGGFDGEAALDAAIARWREAIEQAGREALRASKALLRAASSLPERADLRANAVRTIAERRASAEGQEGLRAFFEKREPSWRQP